jgi:hypothetical protein
MTPYGRLVSLALLALTVATPASAELQSVAAQDLSRFVGLSVRGAANANLGVVTTVDTNLGLIGLAGKYGQFATLHISVLKRDGLQLVAPALNVAHISEISLHVWARPGLVAVARPTMTPTITVEEPPYIEQPRDQLSPQ